MKLKRLFDFCSSGVALIALLPFFVLLAVVVMLSSPGGVFYKQTRVGMNGKKFKILKFRSMYCSEYGGLSLTVGDDNRVTPVGRTLRRYKLDELPQLINVLLGDMSVVGPRPEVPHYVELYPESTKEIVLSVRPGLTDPSSLAFLDESALLSEYEDPERGYIDIILPRKLKLSSDYIANRSFLGDIHIIFKTIARVFS